MKKKKKDKLLGVTRARIREAMYTRLDSNINDIIEEMGIDINECPDKTYHIIFDLVNDEVRLLAALYDV